MRTAALYVAWNPVRARLAARPQDWHYASTRAHLRGADDPLLTAAPLLERVGDFAAFLAEGERREESDALRARETTGRPLGAADFVAGLERMLGDRWRNANQDASQWRAANKDAESSPVTHYLRAGALREYVSCPGLAALRPWLG